MLDMSQLKKNVGKWTKTEEEEMHKSASERSPEVVNRPPQNATKEPATIGASIKFKGELSGEEDFIIQGVVEGRITLTSNNLTIGPSGRIKADIFARTIIIEGELQGDMNGDEKVIIRKTGRVRGNIVSPRVTLEDGAKFKGSIEMEPQNADAASKPAAAKQGNESHKTGPGNSSPDRKMA